MNAHAGYLEFRRGRLLLIAAVLWSAAVAGAAAESLWEPGFRGYVSDAASVELGDVVRVRIDLQNTFSLTTMHSDSQEVRFSFQGGEGEGLLSFLPQGSSGGSQEVEEEGSYTLSTGVVAEVVETREHGRFLLRGSRSVVINGKREELVVEGEFAPAMIDDGEIDFEELLRSQLTYTAPGMGEELELSEEDLRAREAPADTSEDAAAENGERAPEESGTGYSLREEKQRELLRRYMNRILDILFQR
jgi:flagellar basal body L-ring protein FlgH